MAPVRTEFRSRATPVGPCAISCWINEGWEAGEDNPGREATGNRRRDGPGLLVRGVLSAHKSSPGRTAPT
jgi:hypothetical protein